LAHLFDYRFEHLRRFHPPGHQLGQTAQGRLLRGESLILDVQVTLPVRTFAGD
jgi:hypothetical protein